MIWVAMAAALAGQPGVCQTLTASIEASEKEISALDQESIGDNSAPRATMNATKQSAQYGQINANILLMEANHCAPRSEPINPGRWMLSALQCKVAEQKEITANLRTPQNITVPPECDREKWTPLRKSGAADGKTQL